jgi:hypothetical protein
MCGPSQSEQNLSAAQTQMYNTLSSNYNQTFPEQQAITGALTSAFQPILAAGPDQEGFTPSEKNALETQNVENVATNYGQAQKTAADILAGRGGGDTFLPSGTSADILAQNANAAAATRSQQQTANTLADYAQGRQNYLNAAQILGNTASTINPLGYASASTSAGNSAFNSASTITNQSNSIWNAAIGALGGIGSAALGNAGGLTSLFSKSATPPAINPNIGTDPLGLYSQGAAPATGYTNLGLPNPVPFTGGSSSSAFGA